MGCKSSLHTVSEQVVCRACSRNRYPLKYLKDRVAKVCDHCYAELRKRGESQLPIYRSVSLMRDCLFHFDMLLTVCVCLSVGGSVSGACGNSSPRTHRASRPLSAVFQSLQPPSLWKSRKSTSPLNQVDYTSHLASVPLFHFKHLTTLKYVILQAQF